MLTHKQVWAAIDMLASENGLSASGLARKAGLAPTTFNKSKRINPQGKPRWPNLQTISVILNATDTTFGEFAEIASQC